MHASNDAEKGVNSCKGKTEMCQLIGVPNTCLWNTSYQPDDKADCCKQRGTYHNCSGLLPAITHRKNPTIAKHRPHSIIAAHCATAMVYA